MRMWRNCPCGTCASKRCDMLACVCMQAAAEASAIPQGMRVLPEEERQEMLTLLARSRAEEEEKLLVMASRLTCTCACRHCVPASQSVVAQRATIEPS